VVEDAGVAMTSGVDAPTGALGVALTTAAAGQATIALFGRTYGVPTSAAQVPGTYQVVGLVGVNNAVTPNTKYDLSADAVVLRNPSDGSTITKVNTGVLTNDTSVAGPAAGGKDQAGAFAANNWIHFYFIIKADGTGLSTLSSLTTPPTGPTLPATYTHWAYAGAVRYNATPLLIKTTMRGSWMTYTDGMNASNNALAGGAATTETAVSLAAFVPPNAKMMNLYVQHSPNGAGGFVGIGFVTGTIAIYCFGPVAGQASDVLSLIPQLAQNVYYTNNAASGSTALRVQAYQVANGGE
jgi:hypothetical protein